jgi:ABC-type transport system involved in cytochrome c biogenesis ATPase subunit
VNSVEELHNEKRELLAILSATLWVLEHPEVNAIRFCGNPRELAQRIRCHLDRGGMTVPTSEPANGSVEPRAKAVGCSESARTRG